MASTLEMQPEDVGLFFREWLGKSFCALEWMSVQKISMDKLFEKFVIGYANRDIVFRSFTQELIQTLKSMREGPCNADTPEDNLPEGWHRIVGPTEDVGLANGKDRHNVSDIHVVNDKEYPGRVFVFYSPAKEPVVSNLIGAIKAMSPKPRVPSPSSFFLRVPTMHKMKKAIEAHGLSSLCVPNAALITWASRDEIEALEEQDRPYKFVIVMDTGGICKQGWSAFPPLNFVIGFHPITKLTEFVKCQIAQLCCLGFPISRTFWIRQNDKPGQKGHIKQLIVMPSDMDCFVLDQTGQTMIINGMTRLELAKKFLSHLSPDPENPLSSAVYDIALYELKCNRLAHDRFVATLPPKSGPLETKTQSDDLDCSV